MWRGDTKATATSPGCCRSGVNLALLRQGTSRVGDVGAGQTPAACQPSVTPHLLCPAARQQDLMMLDGFMLYLLSAAGDILNQEHTRVHQDMSQPLCHYFISSSHNTYLTRNQIGGTSSTEAYVRWVSPARCSMPGWSCGSRVLGGLGD